MSVMWPDMCPKCGEKDLAARIENRVLRATEDCFSGMAGEAIASRFFRGVK